jgi:3-oxoacyl-[acyl-carrier protein] reductase
VKALSDETAPHGVTVNALCPGMFDTQRVAKLTKARAQAANTSVEEERARGIRAIPAGRYGDPTEFGALAAFLASEKAGFVTGQAIRVDGGAGRAI